MNLQKSLATLLVFASVLVTFPAMAGNDASIKGETRTGIQQAMQKHIQSHSHHGKYMVYDAVAGELKTLKLKALHTGIVKKGQFFVSCADFTDASGKLYDLDLLVLKRGKGFQVVESVVHSINKKKRKYHLES